MSSVDLTNELRLAKPRAPEQLRERVLALGERAVRQPRFSLPPRYTVRRVALIAASAVVAIGVGAAAIHGIANSGAPEQQAVPRDTGGIAYAHGKASRSTTVPSLHAAVPFSAQHEQQIPKALTARGRAIHGSGAFTRTVPSVLAPSHTRLQQYQAAMTVRVDGLDQLSPSTQEAMRIARGLGGYVVSAKFNAAKEGTSALVFKIPIAHVQQAIAKFSELGTIAAQDIRIADLQAQFNRLVERIGALRVAIAKVDDQLASTTLSNEDRVKLEQRRARLASALAALQTNKARTSKRAALATISLGLTTHEAAVVAKPHHRGPLGRALHDAGSILQKEASWAVYALIVLGPLLLVGLAAFLLIRGGRRLSDRRLLESS